MSLSDTIGDEVLDKILSGTAISTAQVTHISLHTADPGTTGVNEATGGSYARQAISFAASASKTAASSGDVSFTEPVADTYTHFGLWTDVSAGVFIHGDALSSNVTVDGSQDIDIDAGDITVSIA